MAYYTKPTDILDDEKIRLSQLKVVTASAEEGFGAAEAALGLSEMKDCFTESFTTTIIPTAGQDKTKNTIAHGLGKSPSMVCISALVLNATPFSSYGLAVGDEILLSSGFYTGTSGETRNYLSFYQDDTNLYVLTPKNNELWLMTTATYTRFIYAYTSGDATFEYKVRAWV